MVEATAVPSESLKLLCVTAHPDRPEAETLIGLRARGFTVHAFCSPRARRYARLDESGVEITPLDIRGKLDRNAVSRIRSKLRSSRYDVMYLVTNKAYTNGLIAARGSAVKIVGYRGIVGNESFLNPISWLRSLNPRVERVVCVAEAVRRAYLDMRLGPLRVPASKPVTIYKGHDLAWYRDPPAERESLGVPADAFVVCCVANWRPRKGIEVLIDACTRLPDDVHVLLVGNMDAPQLDRRIAASPCRERIHRLGYRDDAAAVAGACDVAVLPSLRREGLAKTVIEAMAYGVPPVVTRVGGSPELVVDGDTGLVVEPGDSDGLAEALLKLRADPELRRELGRRSRERLAAHFSIDATVARMAALFEDVAAQR